MNYNWNWEILLTPPYGGWILSGLYWTVAVALAAWVIAFTLGSVIGVIRTTNSRTLNAIGAAYVSVFRNIPLLVQMFLWYFVMPELLSDRAGHWVKRELPNPEYWTAVFCLGTYTAARVGEQVRAGINAITLGQRQSAMSI